MGRQQPCVYFGTDGRTDISFWFQGEWSTEVRTLQGKGHSLEVARGTSLRAFLGGTAAERQAEELPTEQGANLRLENIPQLPIFPSSWHLGSTEKGMFPLFTVEWHRLMPVYGSFGNRPQVWDGPENGAVQRRGRHEHWALSGTDPRESEDGECCGSIV